MNKDFSACKIDDTVLNALYGYYVRYDKLTQLINENFKGSSATTLNLFIDVNNILCKLEEYCLKSNSYPSSETVVMAGLINMAAHYRYFFRSRYNCHTKIYLLNSINNTISPLYDASFVHPHPKTEACRIDNALMNQICKYIPDVAYLTGTVEFVTMVSALLGKEKGPVIPPNLVISKDPYANQLTKYVDNLSPVMVMRPSKFQGQDNSYIISLGNNAIIEYARGVGSKVKSDEPIDPYCLAVYMALTRVPSRGMKSFYPANKAIDIINTSLYRVTSLYKYPWDPDFYFTKLIDTYGDPRLHKDIPFLVNRFKAVESVYFHLLGYKDTMEYKMLEGMVNLYDPRGMQEINEKYFKNTPLDLEVF